MKRGVFALLGLVVPSLLLLGVAEFGVRWRTTGGFGAALDSFAFEPEHRASWLISDPDLDYKLNPASEGVNSLGIRHREIGVPADADSARVVVIGDSVAFDPGGFVDQLGEVLVKRGFEVINASIPGYTTHQERILLERDLLALEPTLVVLQYCMNDNHRFLHRLEPEGHWIMVPEAFGEDSTSWVPDWLARSFIVKRVQWRLEASARAEREAREPFPWRNAPEFGNAWLDESWTEQEVELRAIRDASQQAGARVAIVVFPLESQLARRALDQDEAYTLKPQRALAEIALRLGVPMLDLHPAFLAADAETVFRDGLHLSDAGQSLAAREILAFLETASLLEPR